jgi:hypothetical protein
MVAADNLISDITTSDIQVVQRAWVEQTGLDGDLCAQEACSTRLEVTSRGERPSHITITEPIADQIVFWSVQRELDPLLVLAVIYAESRGDPWAISPCGAVGLMQVMPFHFQWNEWAYDYHTNIGRGTAILAENQKLFGQLEYTLAAYNGGPGAVYYGYPHETEIYIQRVLAYYAYMIAVKENNNGNNDHFPAAQ